MIPTNPRKSSVFPTRFQTAQRPATPDRNSVAPGVDGVRLSGKVEKTELKSPDTRSEAPTGLGKTARMAGLIALGVVGIGLLAGCDGAPAIPGLPGTSQPGNGSEQGEVGELPTAETPAARLEALQKENKEAYNDLAEANYYTHVLRALTQQEAGDNADAIKLSTDALEAYDHNGDPAEQRDNLRDHLQAIAEDADGGVDLKAKALAQAALEIGAGFEFNADQASGGLMAQAKEGLYKEALARVDLLPQYVQTTPGADIKPVKDYADALVESVKLAQTAAEELPEAGARVALYDQTATVLYNRVSTDAETFGGEVMKIISVLRPLIGK